MPAPRKYPDEMRDRAIRLGLEMINGGERLSVNGAAHRVGEQLGINPATLRNSLKQARIDAGEQPGLSSEDRRRLLELEKEVRKLRRANAIAKSASAFFAAELDRPLSR